MLYELSVSQFKQSLSERTCKIVSRFGRVFIDRAYIMIFEFCWLLYLFFGEFQPFTIFQFILFTGLRIGECLGLTWDCIDFENNTVTIRDNLSYAYDEWYISTTKTEGSERVIKLSNYTRNLLLIHKEHQDKSKEVVCKAWKHPDIVFTSSIGNYFVRTYVNKYLKKLCEENGLPPVSVHKLRHSNASLLINSGAALKAVSDRLGHCNIAITADIYGHIFDSYEARMAQSLEADLL